MINGQCLWKDGAYFLEGETMGLFIFERRELEEGGFKIPCF